MNELFLHGMGSCKPDDAAVGEDAQRVAQLPLKDYIPVRKSRRFGRVAKLMYVAASRALEDAGAALDGSFAIVSATGMGEVHAGLTILEQIQRTQGVTISPAQVPNSVHNSPAGHLTLGQEAPIPAVTVSQGSLSAEAALATAADLLDAGVATRILAVVGDEYDPAWARQLGDRGASVAAQALESQRFAEGAVAVVLGGEPGGQNLGRLNCTLRHTGDLKSAVRTARIGAGIELQEPHTIVLRSQAGGERLQSLIDGEPEDCAMTLQLKDGVYGGSLAGSLAALERHILSGDGRPMLSLSLELDELGTISWRGDS